ncbi:PLP-dependent aminotransferase family protein [Actinomadura rayongensis]|uniref:Aminotransferase class I/II-fold pyridoxal phosphate-dependent enzyme n=1 Tax=Actinomadura rayongensis TaxID=1429076 RepID=A0A6I4W2Y1_9ACTN|nr:PLP-dependent aminotransferase family protein [Actinomadura rayongensis]MXQ64989.1 aminotransferase class I/II-fold pyridoxal phosphate-dependent enzyme [Actinomadura rayongensis]
MTDYLRIADALTAEIDAGRLRPGARLPPQRTFARRHRIAPSTAARVYAELARRGRVVGEVGRGTFVRAGTPHADPALAEPAAAPIDLELNVLTVPGQDALLARGLARLTRPDALAAALRPAGAAGTPSARAAVAALWPGLPADGVRFAAGGRQALAAAVSALVPPGARLAVDEFTYPPLLALADRLGATVVPVPADEHGMRPDALAELHHRAPIAAVYVQPTLHNPSGTTMPAHRRAALAATGLPFVEDAVWAFLDPSAPPPLAVHAPDRTILVDGLSKRLTPGLTLGFALAPPPLAERVASALRAGAWTASGFALEAATGWLTDGTAAAIAAAKRADAARRRAEAATAIPSARGGPHSSFCWWELPEPWRAETFAAAAARHGIAVTPGTAFAARRGATPRAVRLALASPPHDVLAHALTTLADLSHTAPPA